MFRRFLAWGLSIIIRWVDDSVAEEDLHAFVRERLHELAERIHAGNIDPDNQDVQDILNATERLRRLGYSWPAQFDQASISHTPPAEELLAPITADSPPAVHRGWITSGAGDRLLADLRRDEPMPVWQMEQMEALLRHIEVRRRAGLRFQPSMTEHEHWTEIQKLSLLFTRHAKQQQDYRFLNTALKLNDWSYKYFRTSRLTPRVLDYLQAVLEAEATLIEMTT